MDLTRIPGRGGLAAPRGDSFFVGVGRKGGGTEHRFTFAHELAHVMLGAVDREALGLDSDTEEELCELFARRALAPPALVEAYLREAGMPADLGAFDRFAKRFRISQRASLVVLDEVLPAQWPVAFAVASWRPHPRRDGVFGMRIDCSAADDRVFLPTDCRLSTLGYRRLEAWALEGELGSEALGSDDGVDLRSKRAGISGWVGESAWRARRYFAPASRAEDDERGVLCRLDVARLSPRRPARRRLRQGAAQPRPVVELPGQLRF
jgi:hypothetical protein